MPAGEEFLMEAQTPPITPKHQGQYLPNTHPGEQMKDTVQS